MRRLLPVVAVVAGLAGLCACSRPQPAPAADVAPASVAAPASAPAGATLGNPKIAPVLAATARKVRSAPNASAASGLSTRFVHVNARGEVQVYIRVTRFGADVRAELEKAGARVEQASKPLGVYQAWASPAALERLATLAAVTRITPPSYGLPKAGG